MSPFVSGALGAVTILLVAGLVRRWLWRRRFLGRRRGGWFLRRVARRIGARPEQERVFHAEVDAVAGELRGLRDDARALRAELADLVAGPALDAGAVKRALEARLARLDAVKTRLAEALTRVHATLEPSQRVELAAILRHGPRRLHGHPHHA